MSTLHSFLLREVESLRKYEAKIENTLTSVLGPYDVPLSINNSKNRVRLTAPLKYSM